MAKAVFGEFGAFTSRDSVRYTKNKQMVSKDALPKEVVAFLNAKLGYTPKEEQPPVDNDHVAPGAEQFPETQTPESVPAFAPPSEEEKARLRAESLKVNPELQATPEKLAEDAAALTEDDFDAGEPETPQNVDQADTEPSAAQMHDVATALAGDRELPPEVKEAVNSMDTMHVDSNYLETVSIHTAPLEDITRALYERFGIYTVYLRQLPNPDEVNPLTGEPFTKYHQGIAYQAAIGAQNRGVLDRPAEEGRRLIDENRAASENFKVDPVPRTMADARRADSFDFRTSVKGNESQAASEIVHITDENGQVHAVQRPIPAGQTGEFNGAKPRYDAEEDEVLVEPQMGKQVIRPNW